MTPLQRYIDDLNHEREVIPSMATMEFADVERRVAVVYGQDEVDWQKFGRQGWTPQQRLQAVVAVKLMHGGAQLWARDLPEGHPMREPERKGRYPVHTHMMSMVGERAGWSDAGLTAKPARLHGDFGAGPSSYHFDNGSADDETGITSVYGGGRGGVLQDGDLTDTEFAGLGLGPVEPLEFNMIQPAMEGVISGHPPVPAKPVLHVPEGCVLVIPDDVQPWDFLARYDTTQMGRTAVVVNRKGYAMLGKMAEQQKVEAVEAKRTHAALTFEQPIKNRLGGLAR